MPHHVLNPTDLPACGKASMRARLRQKRTPLRTAAGSSRLATSRPLQQRRRGGPSYLAIPPLSMTMRYAHLAPSTSGQRLAA